MRSINLQKILNFHHLITFVHSSFISISSRELISIIFLKEKSKDRTQKEVELIMYIFDPCGCDSFPYKTFFL